MTNKKTFKVADREIAVVRPNHRAMQAAQLVYNRAFREAVTPADGKPGALVRAKVEAVLREQNLWDADKQARYESIMKRLLGGEKRLAQGGIKLSEAREIALDMRGARLELRQLTAQRNELDQHTAEAQAEQARFNHLVASSTVYGDTGKPYFESVDDYLSRDNDPVTLPAAEALGKLLYGLEDDYEQKLPESVFLLRYGFVNSSLQLVRKSDGRLIDSQGRLLDDKGRLVNESGELVDNEGNLLTEEGNYKLEFTDFIDDTAEATA